MNVFLTYYKSETLKALIWLILIVWSTGASIGLLLKKDQIIFVKMKPDAVEIVRELDPSDESYLEKVFIKRFAQLHYTFDSKNFDSNIQSSSNIMSHDLWNKIEDRIRKQKAFFSGKIVAQTAVIERIVRKDFKYEIDLDLVSQLNTETIKRKFKIKLEVGKVQRTIHNPFGFVITDLLEEENPL